uniref:Uncharacterized protein n=1 Tax=Ignisphaera aggregans TaxID=334771 RepID=A0A7J3ZAJ4_9CREN
MIICVLYGIYTPSFGSDTWHDATQATQTIARGGLKDLTIVHQAYPIPVVPLLYAVYSIVAGLNTLWSSSILGLLYLLLVTLWVYTYAFTPNPLHIHTITLIIAEKGPCHVFKSTFGTLTITTSAKYRDPWLWIFVIRIIIKLSR